MTINPHALEAKAKELYGTAELPPKYEEAVRLVLDCIANGTLKDVKDGLTFARTGGITFSPKAVWLRDLILAAEALSQE